MPSFSRSGLLASILALAGCARPAPAARDPARHAGHGRSHDPRGRIKEWSASAQAKDVDKFTSVYAEDATVMMEGAPDVTGKAAIREAITGMMQDPNFALSFAANKVVVARAGDLRLRDRHVLDDDERREEEHRRTAGAAR